MMRSVCGLDCESCPAYIATKNNDDKLRAETAVEWSEKYNMKFSADMINCTGCKNKDGVHIGHWSECPLRLCAVSKSIPHCADCSELNQCEKVKSFQEMTGLDVSRDGWQ